MKRLKLCLIGFGNAGREFARILIERGDRLSGEFDCSFAVIAIATKSRGGLIDPDGIDLPRALSEIESQGKFSKHNPAYSNILPLEIINSISSDVVVEITPLNIMTAQPAIDHIKAAFSCNKHVITLNKGPIARSYEELRILAEKKGKLLLFEGTVMDGAPVFNLASETLLGCEVQGFKGILNSTTNFILCRMEKGDSMHAALAKAKQLGIAEADPSMDIEGWDAAAKTSALLNVFMQANYTPEKIARAGIEEITPAALRAAKADGKTIKLISEGYRKDGRIHAKVAPTPIPMEDPLAQIQGTSSSLTILTDLMGELTIIESNPGIRQTAYAILIDLLTLVKRLQVE